MAILESSKCVNDLFYLYNIINSVLIDTSVGWQPCFSFLFWIKFIILTSESDYFKKLSYIYIYII